MPKELKKADSTWSLYSEEELGIPALTMHNNDTGVTLATILGNPELRLASYVAWAGARHSRAPGDTIDILLEMKGKGVNPDEKLETTFKTYGHASVGDMARLAVQFNNVPMHFPAAMFNATAINSGQEKSTRYQKEFSGAILHPLKMYLPEQAGLEALEGKYQDLGRLALMNFKELKEPITKSYTEFYKPENEKQEKSLGSRVLDTIRFNLLLGQSSGFALETSARDWSRMIGQLKASPMKYYRSIGNQLEEFLAPNPKIEEELGFLAEAPSLIRHTDPDNTVKKDMAELREFLEQNNFKEALRGYIRKGFQGVQDQKAALISPGNSSVKRMAAQYILALEPRSDYNAVLGWLDHLPDEKKSSLSNIIMENHSHHKEIPLQLARTSDISVVMEGTLGELRDFNRHRAFGRFMQNLPLFYGEQTSFSKAMDYLESGFGLPSYINDVKEFSGFKKEMIERLNDYYDGAINFMQSVNQTVGDDVDYGFIQNIMPLAHKSNLWLHGAPRDAHYLTRLRVRPGGHINYRILTYDAAQLISESDPFLFGMKMEGRPDPASREEFFDRS